MSTQSVVSNDALKEQIRLVIGEHINDYIAEYVHLNEIKLKELSLIERVVRVEEELKALKILEQKRHEFLVTEMNTRFETMNARFESLQKEMNTRFEAMNSRFEAMNARFESLQKEMNTRFEVVNTRFELLQREMDTRFELLQKDMNTRFEAMDKRFDSLERRFSFMQWLIASGFALVALLTTLK